MLSAVFCIAELAREATEPPYGLFLPAVGDWIEENCLEASTPYTLDANRQLKISAHIIIDGNGSVPDAVSIGPMHMVHPIRLNLRGAIKSR